MLLRTRIALIVSLLLGAIVAVMAYSTEVRERGQDQRFEQLMLTQHTVLWQRLVDNLLDRARTSATALLEEDDLLDAIAAGNRTALLPLQQRLADSPLMGDDLERLDLFTPANDLLFSTDASYFSAYWLGGTGERSARLDEQDAGGTRVIDGRLMGLVATPIERADEPIGTAELIVDLDPQVELLARSLEADVYVADRSGRLIHGTQPVPWDLLAEVVDLTTPSVHEIEHDDHRYSAATVIATDVGGGRSAALVIVTDVTVAAESRDLWDAAFTAAVVLIATAGIALLSLYLRGAFAPLYVAIEALNKLSAGQTDHYAELSTGQDEIGEIGRATDVFRGNTLELARRTDERQRRRRRQARFIRRQMEVLSETLDEEAQESALEDLRKIESAALEPDDESDEGGVSDELGLIGVALESMTQRVRDQQQALSQMVEELREALAVKTRLIGLEQELDIARQMQQNILPREFPRFGRFALAGRMVPAKEVGGDFYDFFSIDEKRLGIAVADVSGKGIPAAFFMLIARTLMKAICLNGAGPGLSLARLNEFLYHDNDQMMFVTLFYGELDLDTGRFVYANGGHNPPLLVRRGGAVTTLETTNGIALAAIDQMAFEEKEIWLAPGDTVVMFTDGVTEAFDADGAMYGDDRLERVVADGGAVDVEAMVERVIDSVFEFGGRAPQSDDITCIAIKSDAISSDVPMAPPDIDQMSSAANIQGLRRAG